jgi:hypothetical protein
VTPQFVAYLTIVIYDRKTFIVQATDRSRLETNRLIKSVNYEKEKKVCRIITEGLLFYKAFYSRNYYPEM